MNRNDPGLQPQRTALAWSRTALALCVNAVAVLRAGTTRSSTAIIVLGIGLLLVSAATVACGAWRRRCLLDPAQPIAPPTWLMGATMVATFVTCLIGLLAIIGETGAGPA